MRFAPSHTPWRRVKLRVEGITHTDLRRIDELLTQYADSRLDLVDSSVVAVAERLDIVASPHIGLA